MRFIPLVATLLLVSHSAFAADSDSDTRVYRESAPPVSQPALEPDSDDIRQAKELYKQAGALQGPERLAKANQAIALALKEQAKNPNSVQAATLLAFIYFGSGDAEDSLPQFDRLIKLMGADGSGPTKSIHPGPLLFKAKLLSNLCRDDEAAKLIKAYWAFWDKGQLQAMYRGLDAQVKARQHHQQKCYCTPRKDLAAEKAKAAAGDMHAQTTLGMMSAQGACQPRDFAVAKSWLDKAAAQGDADAQVALGMIYIEGDGVPRDTDQALKWFRKAADQNNAEAQNSLGVMYYHGDGVPKSLPEAEKWYKLAAANGHEGAKQSLLDNAKQKDSPPADSK